MVPKVVMLCGLAGGAGEQEPGHSRARTEPEEAGDEPPSVPLITDPNQSPQGSQGGWCGEVSQLGQRESSRGTFSLRR